MGSGSVNEVTLGPFSGQAVRVAVLGCGNVGSALVGMLQDRAADLVVQSGARLEVGGIAVSDLARRRDPHIPTGLLTADAAGLVNDPAIDVVVELIGGLEPAGEPHPGCPQVGEARGHRQQVATGVA